MKILDYYKTKTDYEIIDYYNGLEEKLSLRL